MATVIRGFEHSRLVSNHDIASLIKQAPKRHLESLKAIAFISASERLLYDVPSSGEKGAYFPDYRSILFFDVDSIEACKHVLFHELGHFVFHQKITSYQRKQWASTLFTKRQFVSAYAATDPAEDFAESYAYYILDTQKIKAIPEKYHFLRFQVFV